MGIMPQFFEKLSEITGIRFEYLESNADRYELAENLQCEILSMVTEDDESIRERGLIPGPVCFSYENVEYRIAYTGRMPEQMIGIMDAAIEGMSEEDRLQCAIAGAEELLTARESGRIRAAMWILAGLCAGLLVLLAVSVNRSRKNMKKVMIMDSVTRLYNRDGFAEAFSRLKNQRQFPLFWMAYILVDCGRKQYFSMKIRRSCSSQLWLRFFAGIWGRKDLRPVWMDSVSCFVFHRPRRKRQRM